MHVVTSCWPSGCVWHPGLWWIMLLCTFMFKGLYGNMSSFIFYISCDDLHCSVPSVPCRIITIFTRICYQLCVYLRLPLGLWSCVSRWLWYVVLWQLMLKILTICVLFSKNPLYPLLVFWKLGLLFTVELQEHFMCSRKTFHICDLHILFPLHLILFSVYWCYSLKQQT